MTLTIDLTKSEVSTDYVNYIYLSGALDNFYKIEYDTYSNDSFVPSEHIKVPQFFSENTYVDLPHYAKKITLTFEAGYSYRIDSITI